MLLLIAEGLDVYQPLGAMISSAYYSTLLLCGRFHRRPLFSPVAAGVLNNQTDILAMLWNWRF
jgi:hypothetical protein